MNNVQSTEKESIFMEPPPLVHNGPHKQNPPKLFPVQSDVANEIDTVISNIDYE